MSEVLEIRGVFKSYLAGALTLKPTNLLIPGKKLTSLIGPSGCGKTTLLRIIAGIEPPSGGEVLIDGKVCAAADRSERPVGMVFQNYALFPHMNALANVAYGLRMRSVRNAKEIAAQALADLGLQGLQDAEIATLSGGQQQRVALARAMVLQPKILLLDEPLSNLDAALRRHVRDDLCKLQREKELTVLYVTHDHHEAMAVSDHIIVMNEGTVVQSGTPRDVYTKPHSEFVARFMGDVEIFDVSVDAHGVINLGGLQLLANAQLCAGQPAKVLVRPDAWQVGYASITGIAGKIIRKTYFGLTTEYVVETALGPVRASVRAEAMERDLGSPVSLYLDVRRVSIVTTHPESKQWTPVSI